MGNLGYSFTVNPKLDATSSEGAFACKTPAGSCFHLLQLSHMGHEPHAEAGSGASISHHSELQTVKLVKYSW